VQGGAGGADGAERGAVGDRLAPLVLRARDGDGDARDALLRALRPALLRYCTARLAGREEAEDVTQETLLALVDALPRYEDRGVPFTAFAFTVARRRVADSYRASARRPADPVAEVPDGADASAGPEERVLLAERLGTARVLLGQLSEAQRDIVLLRVAAGLSAEETAQVVGSTAGAVRVAQHRALTRLRTLAAAEAGLAAAEAAPDGATVPTVPAVPPTDPPETAP